MPVAGLVHQISRAAKLAFILLWVGLRPSFATERVEWVLV